FGFNVGVELGQIAIVMAFFPIAWALRATWFYRWVVVVSGSLAISAVAILWIVDRI
ncbi:MAG: HupE/UreJ family protein, partial [Burkholderiaceae bacterium]